MTIGGKEFLMILFPLPVPLVTPSLDCCHASSFDECYVFIGHAIQIRSKRNIIFLIIILLLYDTNEKTDIFIFFLNAL